MTRVLNHSVVSLIIFFGAIASACAPMPVPTVPPTQPPPTPTQIPPTATPVTPTPITPTLTPTPAPPTATPAPFTFTSAAFLEGAPIPVKYTCNGENVSPPLAWVGTPRGTKSFALIMEDPDAVVATFTHWVAFDIPASENQIAEGAKNFGKGGANSALQSIYLGPCPPSGIHRYIFTLFALDVETLGLNVGANRAEVENKMNGRILAKIQLMGKYGK
jgi:Raf kinase inhibitor-like YbhB/YbcL family protein